MRILIATSHRNMVGGVEKYVQAILPALEQRGHELALLYEYRFDPQRERIDGAIRDMPSLGTEEYGAEAAGRFARDWKPDLVYSQGLESADLQASLLSEYPTVFFAHNYVGTCISGEKCHAFPNPRPCERRLGPGCVALYYPARCGGLHPGTMWNLYRRAVKRNEQLSRYAAVLVASAHMKREFELHGVSEERLHLTPLPNVQDEAQVGSVARNPLRGNLLFIGRITKLKGAFELFKAAILAGKRLQRELPISVAGDGPDQERLKQFALTNGVRANFLGWISGARKADLIANVDLLAVPSLWPEPFGLVGIEAGASGLPAVGYDVGGISDWLVPGYSGELAPGDPPTVEGLADAIYRALADPSHYAGLCHGAREVAGRFNLAAHVSKLESVLEAVLSAKPASAQRKDAIHADV